MTVDNVYSWANWTLLVALIVGVLSTYAIIASGNIKEKEFKRELSKANERAADANQKAAEANARGENAKLEAAKLKLELAKFRAPRNLTKDQRAKLVTALKEFSGTSFDISGSTNETLMFALDITDTLTKAGWDIRSWTGGGIVRNLHSRTFSAGDVVTTGVHIQIFDPIFSKASNALVNALKLAGFEGVQVTLENVSQEYPNKNVMHINVGPKP